MSKMSDEILNEYIERLAAAGHSIPKSAAQDDTKKADQKHTKYRNEVYPRIDSLSIKDIEGLYGKKPEMTFEYEDNIMEAAHPDPLVMFPAYDKMNALVENENERQKINLNILRRPVSGLEFRRKYASELMQALVVVANDMDFRDNEPLRKLADDTIDHFRKEAGWLDDAEDWLQEKYRSVKDIVSGGGTGATVGAVACGLLGAFLGPEGALEGALAGAWGGAQLGTILGTAGGGLLAAIFKTGPVAKNVEINAKAAKNELDSLIADHPNDIFLTSLSTALQHIQLTANTYSALVSQVQSKGINQPGSTSDASLANAIGKRYIDEIDVLDRMIEVFLTNARSGKYMSDSTGALEKIKEPISGIFGDALHHTMEAMETLEMLTKQAKASITHAQSLTGEATQEQSQAPATSTTPEQPGNNNLLGILNDYISQ